MAGYSSDTVSIATAAVSFVRSAVPGTHVVVLVPDVSIALSPGNVLRLQVIPLVRAKSYILSFMKAGATKLYDICLILMRNLRLKTEKRL